MRQTSDPENLYIKNENLCKVVTVTQHREVYLDKTVYNINTTVADSRFTDNKGKLEIPKRKITSWHEVMDCSIINSAFAVFTIT
jgi:hypothetical protein